MQCHRLISRTSYQLPDGTTCHFPIEMLCDLPCAEPPDYITTPTHKLFVCPNCFETLKGR